METEEDNDGFENGSSRLIFGETAPCFDNMQFLDTGIIDLDSDPDEDYKCINEDIESTVLTRPTCIKLIDCYKFPWYFDQSTKDIIKRNLASNSVNMNVSLDTMDVISKEVHNHANISEYNNKVIYCDNNITLSVKTNISQQITDVSSNKIVKSVSKETDTNRVHKTLNAHRRSDPAKRLAKTKIRNDVDLLLAINQRNKIKADPKKNIGYIGMKVKRITPEKKATAVEVETQKPEAHKEKCGLKTVASKALYNIGTAVTPVLKNDKTLETETDLKYILAEGAPTTTVNEMTKIAEEIIERVKNTTKKKIHKNTNYKNRLCEPMPCFTLKQKYKSEVCKMTKMISPIPHYSKTNKTKNAKQLKNLTQDSVLSSDITSDINIKITENKTGNVHTQNMNNTPILHIHETNTSVDNISIPKINEYIENNAKLIKMQAKEHRISKPSRLQSKEIEHSKNYLESSKNVNAEIHTTETITLPLNTIVMKTAKTDDAKIDGTANNSILDVTQYNASNLYNLVSQSETSSAHDTFARMPPTKGPRKQSLKVTSATTDRNMNNYIKNTVNSKPKTNVAIETPNLDSIAQITIRRNESNNGKQENRNPEYNITVQPPQFTISNSASVIRPTQTSSNQTQEKTVRSHLKSHILYDPQAKPTPAHMISCQEALLFQIAPHTQLHSQYIYQQAGAPAYTPWYPSLTGEMTQYLTMSTPIQNTPPQTTHKRINEGSQGNKQVPPLINWNDRLMPSVYGPIYKQMGINTAQICSPTRMTSNHSLTRFFNGQPGYDFWSPNFPPPSMPQPPLPSMPPPQPPPPPLEPFPEYQYIAKPTESKGNNNDDAKKIQIPDRSNKATDRKDVERINNVLDCQPAVTKFGVQNGLDTSMPRMKNPLGNNELSIISQRSSVSSKRSIITKSDSSNLKNAQKSRTASKYELHNKPRTNSFNINEILLADSLQNSEEFTKRAMTFKHNKVTCTAIRKAPQVKSNDPQPIKEHTMINEPSLVQISNLKTQPLKAKNSQVNDNKAIEVKKSSAVTYKPGPLSKRKRDNEVDSRDGPFQNHKESVLSGIGYSPPVLPIPPTYEKPEAYYKYFNKEDADKKKREEESNMDSNSTAKKQRQYDQNNRVEIDMKRVSKIRIDDAVNNMKNETLKKYTVDVSRRASNVESDAGYDSDIKL